MSDRRTTEKLLELSFDRTTIPDLLTTLKGEPGFPALILIVGLSSLYKDHTAAVLVRDGHIEAATGK